MNNDENLYNSAELIVRCGLLLHSGKSFEDAAGDAMTLIAQVVHPDHLYLGRIDNGRTSLIREWCAEGIKPDLLSFQNMPYEFVSWWKPFLDERHILHLKNTDDVISVSSKAYDYIKARGIHDMIECVLYDREKPIGYFGIDNASEQHADIETMLAGIGLLMSSEMRAEKLSRQLNYESRHDLLTGCFNRRALEEDIASMHMLKESAGVIFADLNQLKQVNSTRGRSAGDQLICSMVQILQQHFKGGSLYRIYGDEIIVIYHGCTEKQLRTLTEHARLDMEGGKKISLGWAWTKDCSDLEETFRQAEYHMYQNKERVSKLL